MAEERGKKIGKELEFFFLLSLCWIVLFDLECSERRALCNISSTHMAVCVTAKHTGGVVAVVMVAVAVVAVAAAAAAAGCYSEGGRGRRGSGVATGPWTTV